jgi:hypothetical protein
MMKERPLMYQPRLEIAIWCLLGTLMFFLDDYVTGGNVLADVLLVTVLVSAVYVRSPER